MAVGLLDAKDSNKAAGRSTRQFMLENRLMGPRTVVALATLLVGACSSGSSGSKPPPSSPGTGGAPVAGSGGVPGGTAGTGGTGGSGGTVAADASTTAPGDVTPPAPDAASPDQMPATPSGPTVAGGAALMVVGKGPLIGDDLQIQKVLTDIGLKVETVEDAVATPANAMGKRVVILSYSLDSDLFKNKAAFTDVAVPFIVMEHALLGTLGMATNHKWAEPVTQITITAADSPLAAGLPAGDVTVYQKSGEVFWGVPADGAIKVASVKGNANQWTIFAYAAGTMMMTKPAPAKRLQFFMGAHQVPTQYMNAAGLKLLDAAVRWSIQ
jgi:hypothetical protein